MRGRLLATGVVVALLSGCATTTSSSSSGSAADAALVTPCNDLHDFVYEAHRGAKIDFSALQRDALNGVNDSTGTLLASDFKTLGDLTVQMVNGQIPTNTSDLYTAVNDGEATCGAVDLWVEVPEHT